jgi:hypothetical protein
MKIETFDKEAANKAETVRELLSLISPSLALIAHHLCVSENACRKWIRENRIPKRTKKLLAFVYGLDEDAAIKKF